jgi:hypothetical protein
LSDPPLQSRFRQIRFSSTVSETFILSRGLSEGLVLAAKKYWESKGMVIKTVQMPERFSANIDPVEAEFVAEGGTIWTTNFDSYKKMVTVSLSGGLQQTKIFVHMVLPGGLMSLQDRERAANLIQSFYEVLQTCGS